MKPPEEINLETPEPPSENPPPEKPPAKAKPKQKRSLIGRLFRWGFYGLLFTIILLVGIGWGLKYFPWDQYRPTIEDKLSEKLNTPVKVGKILIDLPEGIHLRNVTFGENPILFSVNELILDYNLKELFKGKLTVDHIKIDSPQVNLVSRNGNWNFQPILDSIESSKEQSETEPSSDPSSNEPSLIPLRLDLQKLEINNIHASTKIDDKLEAIITGISLLAEGQFNPENINAKINLLWQPSQKNQQPYNLFYRSTDPEEVSLRTLITTNLNLTTNGIQQGNLSGAFSFNNNFIQIGQVLPSPQIAGMLQTTLNLERETFQLDNLILNIGKENSIKASGSAENIFEDPKFIIDLIRTRFNFEELVALAKDFLPPLNAQGILEIKDLKANGRFKNNQIEKLKLSQGEIKLNKVFVQYPELEADLKDLSSNIIIKNLILEKSQAKEADAIVDIFLDDGKLGSDYWIHGLHQNLIVHAEGEKLSEGNIKFHTQLKQSKVNLPEIGIIQTPLKIDGEIRGNLQSGDLPKINIDLALDESLKNTVEASFKNFGKNGFTLDNSLQLNFNQIAQLLPEKILKPTGIQKLSGISNIHTVAKGLLNENFLPTKADAQNIIKIENMGTKIFNPNVTVNGLNLYLSVPAIIKHKQGIKIPELEIKGNWKQIEAQDNWSLGSMQLATHLKTDQFVSLDGKFSPINVQHQLMVQIDKIKSIEPPADISGLNIDLSTGSKVISHKEIRNITLKGKISASKTRTLKKVKTGSLETNFDIKATNQNFTKTQAKTFIIIHSPELNQNDFDFKLDRINLQTQSQQNLKTGEVRASLFSLDMLDLLHLEANGHIKKWGDWFTINSTLSKTNIGNLYALIPSQFKEGLEGLNASGTLGITLIGEGKQPNEKEIKSLNLPLRIDTKINLNNLSIEWPEQGLKVDSFNALTHLKSKNNQTQLTGNIDFGKVFKDGLPDNRPLEPNFKFDFLLDKWDHLEIRETQLNMDSKEIDLKLNGQIEGLGNFIRGKLTPDFPEIVKAIDFALQGTTSINAQTLSPWLPGFKGKGLLNSKFNTNLIAGKSIQLNGEIDFNHLTARYEDITNIEELHGKFLLSKNLLLDKSLLRTPSKSFSVSQKGFFRQLRDFSNFKNIIKIKSVKVGNHKISDIKLDLFYKDNRFFVENFLMKALGASIGGNLFLTQTKDGPELSFSSEFAGIDFNSLAKESRFKKSKDSKMDGNLHLDFKIGQADSKNRVNLDQLSSKINITRIGREVLDRVLIFIDPEESKPAIVDTRAKLKLASPRKVALELENGNISVAVWLYNKLIGGILKAPELKRVPITRLKPFRDFAENLQTLRKFQSALQYLSAKGISFDEQGNITVY